MMDFSLYLAITDFMTMELLRKDYQQTMKKYLSAYTDRESIKLGLWLTLVFGLQTVVLLHIAYLFRA